MGLLVPSLIEAQSGVLVVLSRRVTTPSVGRRRRAGF